MKRSRLNCARLLFSQLLLGSMIATVMTSAYADDNDPQHQAERRAELNKQRASAAMQGAMASSQAPGMHFMPLAPRIQPAPQSAPQPQIQQNNPPQNRPPQNTQPRTQPTIQNAPVGFNRTNNPVNTSSTTLTRYQGSSNSPQGSQPQDAQSWGSRWNHDSDRQHDWHDQGRDRDQGRDQGFNNGVRFNNNISFNNANNVNQNPSFHRDFDHDSHFNSDWDRRYRMPYRRGDTGGYRVHYVQSWPRHYDWWEHGWREDYRTVDPYWFAVITSIAVAQAWSDAEVTQAINDNNLRQQLIYDAGVRQQMIDSGYPADQVVYPDDAQYDDQGLYGQSPYPAQYSQGQVVIQSSQSGYYPPPNQPAPSYGTGYATGSGTNYVSPSSPLYGNNQNVNSQGTNLASGAQVANLNANKNALFFCTAGNKPATIQAMSQIQKTDLSVWKTMERFDRCAAWATP